MRYSDFSQPFRAPSSHPHRTTAKIDPADHRRVVRYVEERRELKLLGTEDNRPNRWTVHVGCASERVREAFDEWADHVL